MYILLSPTSFPDVHITGVFGYTQSVERFLKKRIKRWKSIDVLVDWTEVDDENCTKFWPKATSANVRSIDMKPKTHVSIRTRKMNKKTEVPDWLLRTFNEGIKPTAFYEMRAVIDTVNMYIFKDDFLVEFQ